jgi:hypothetical protein
VDRIDAGGLVDSDVLTGKDFWWSIRLISVTQMFVVCLIYWTFFFLDMICTLGMEKGI